MFWIKPSFSDRFHLLTKEGDSLCGLSLIDIPVKIISSNPSSPYINWKNRCDSCYRNRRFILHEPVENILVKHDSWDKWRFLIRHKNSPCLKALICGTHLRKRGWFKLKLFDSTDTSDVFEKSISEFLLRKIKDETVQN